MAKEKRTKQIRTASKRSAQVDDLRPEEAVQVLRRLLEKRIYAFHHEAETEFRDSAPDDPGEAFHWVLEQWKKVQNARTARAQMRTELAQRCPAWATGKW